MEKERIVGNIDHIAIAVRDLEKAKEFFSDLLDTEFMDYGAFEEFGWKGAMSPGGVELMAPTRPDSDMAKFLDKKGEGVYAIAFTVKDTGKAREKAEKKGIRIAGDIGFGEFGEIWLHPKDNHGVYVMFTAGNPFHPWEKKWYKEKE